MSSILKALKKLELEKARRQEGNVDIARDILRSPPRRKKANAWLIPGAVSALLVLAALAGYALVGGFSPIPVRQAVLPSQPKSEETALNPTPTPPPSVAADDDGQDLGALPSIEPRVVEIAIESLPVSRPMKKAAAVPEVSEIEHQEPSQQGAVPPKVEDEPGTEGSPAEMRPEEPPSRGGGDAAMESASVPLPESPKPSLSLTGIAYGEAVEDRLAVVNGLPVMEGTVIEGAKVEKILPDRVRFSIEGRDFEVLIGGEE